MPADAADQERKPDSRPAPAEDKPEGAAATGTTQAAGPDPGGGVGAQEIKRKASVGAVDDPAEKAADAEADRVMRMPETAPEKSAETGAGPGADPRPAAGASAGAGPGPGAGAAPGGAASAAGAAATGGAPAADEPVRRQAAPPAGTPVVGATAAEEKPAETGTPAPAAEPPAPEGEPPARGTPPVSEELQQYLDASRGKGAPLPEEVRKEFEGKFQRSFADVRIHDNSAADDAVKSIDALAFTRGNDIYFRSGSFDPTTDAGKRLLAHELAHVVQQRPGVNRAVVRRKVAPGLGGAMIRRTKNAASKKKVGTETTVDRTTAPKGKIDTKAKTLELDELKVPGWKAAGDFAVGTPKWRTGKEKRDDKQRKLWWDSATLKGQVKTGVEKRVKDLKLGATGPYKLQGAAGTSGGSAFLYTGSADDIAGALVIPPWNGLQKFAMWDVDHKKEWQIGGEDDIANFWLLDPTINSSTGNKIKSQIYADIRAYLDKVNPDLAKPQSAEGIKAAGWNVTWKGLKSDGAGFPHHSKWWKAEDIGGEKHMKGLEKFTGKAEDLEGSPDRLAIYPRKGGGHVKHIDIKDGKGAVSDWKSSRGGYTITSVTWFPTGPSPESGIVGELSGEIFKDDKLLKKPTKAFKPKIEGMAGVKYGGIIDKASISDLRSSLVAKFASPIEFPDLDFDFTKGVVGRGAIKKPEAKILEKVEIAVVLDGEVGVEAAITADALSMPGPFKVQGGALILGASASGLTVTGQVDFEIEKLAKGYLKAAASTKAGEPGFALEGKLDFDTDMFTEASLGLSYKDGKWGVSGKLAVGPDKIKGIKRAAVQVEVQDDTVTATGDFETSIKGVDKGKVGFKYNPNTGMEITGEIELGKGIPGVKSGKLDATVKQGANGWTLAGGVSIQPAVPGLTGNVTGRYEDGAFLVEADLGYERGRAKGTVKIGVTNQAVGPDGKPAGPPQPDGALVAYGGGSVTLTITPWLQGTVGLQLKPNGEIEVTGEVRLPSSFEVFPEKKVEKRVFSIGLDIPIIGVAVAGQRIGIFATIRGGMDIRAGFGPGQLKDVSLKVTYNPDHEDQTTVTGTGTFFVPAGAGLRLSVDGGLGAGIPIVSATAGLTIFGEVGVEGAASASATVTWTPAAGVVLDAKGELSVQPKFKFGIEAFVDVSADLVLTTIELYKKKWSLASFEYGSNLTFGLVFPIHYESGKPFDISFDQIQWKYPTIAPGELLGGLMKQLVG